MQFHKNAFMNICIKTRKNARKKFLRMLSPVKQRVKTGVIDRMYATAGCILLLESSQMAIQKSHKFIL